MVYALEGGRRSFSEQARGLRGRRNEWFDITITVTLCGGAALPGKCAKKKDILHRNRAEVLCVAKG